MDSMSVLWKREKLKKPYSFDGKFDKIEKIKLILP